MTKEMLSDGNKKYRYRKDIRVLTWGLPPISTCPGAGLCKAFCYARAGRMLMGSATTAMARRFKQSKRADFVAMMVNELSRRKCDMVRLHDSGDFYGIWYLDKNSSWNWNGEPADTYGVFGIGVPNAIPVTGKW